MGIEGYKTKGVEGPLEKGFCVKTLFGGITVVDKFLAEGGQGWIYLVEYQGEQKALKWYKNKGMGETPTAFYENIKQNVMRGAPSREFLWPLDITEWVDGTFGYVMDLRPEGYYEVTEYMLCHVRFRSFRTIVDSALRIVSAFRILHNAGYSYQDINDGNFFIHPETGKVLICDNDNVAPDGTETGIIGKPRYLAPEIAVGKSRPNSLSDRFSMSLILYILFCLNHPLEGKRYLTPVLTQEYQEKLYGTEPLFMMDPTDDRNGPDPVYHKNSIVMWKYMPEYMRNIFLEAFSKKAFQKPEARPKELDWLQILTRFRSEIVDCSCGNEIFTQQGQSCTCEECGCKINIKHCFALSGYQIPAIKGSRIYRCQLGVCDEKDALSAVAQVVAKKNGSGELGIRNKSGRRWDAITSKGVPRKVAPNEVVPVKEGIQLLISGEKIVIKAN